VLVAREYLLLERASTCPRRPRTTRNALTTIGGYNYRMTNSGGSLGVAQLGMASFISVKTETTLPICTKTA
jgi:dTDP-4-amino-4,6-dideoxygalactose transaminase